jgi:hypothetical protein
MPIRDKALLIAAWGLIGLAAALLRLLPFRRLAPLLGMPIGAVACLPLASKRQLYRAHAVRRAILRAARVAPFRSDCLPQAIVAAVLCRVLGVPAATHLGVRLDEGPEPMAAHAWVACGPAAITGGHGFRSYAPVACFVSPWLALRPAGVSF